MLQSASMEQIKLRLVYMTTARYCRVSVSEPIPRTQTRESKAVAGNLYFKQYFCWCQLWVTILFPRPHETESTAKRPITGWSVSRLYTGRNVSPQVQQATTVRHHHT